MPHYNCDCLECVPAAPFQTVKVKTNQYPNAIAPLPPHSENVGEVYHAAHPYYKVVFAQGIHFLFKANELRHW